MTVKKADVVIVGSGVAGGLIAHQLALKGNSVLLLEAGPRYTRGELVERFRNHPNKTNSMAPYPSTHYAPHPEYEPNNAYFIQQGEQAYQVQYVRAVGGTTWHWAGSTWRFLPVDFRLKSNYGVGRDWPITYTDLEPWYQSAEEALGVSGPNDEELGSPRSQPYPMAALPISYNEQVIKARLNANGFNMVTEPVARNSRPYDKRPTCCGSNNCIPICPIGAMYCGITHVEKAEAAGAKLISKAVVYHIEKGPEKRIVAVHYKTPEGESVKVEGQYFVLAANGIETPKLMLNSEIGNSSDMVGRNLMDHLGVGVRFFVKERLWPGRGPQEMTSIVGWRDGRFRSHYAGKKLQLSNLNRTEQMTQEILAQDRLIIGAQLDSEIRDKAARYVEFSSFHEQLPHPENRIIPSRAYRDGLGIARPTFYYEIDDYVKRSIVHTREVYNKIAKVMEGTNIHHSDRLFNNHHICGTTLMGSSAKDSVVDGDCRTHDHPNLFIASSGTMPTSGSVNCTLTIAALSLRIADTLKREM
ncbi:GMC family oxidoreductase [uncultured Shewanella sp.]|uniref:GMC family oxidoreductase n=1 Tax=uncultured Shewanella sp. TaxID=173975 RepID=UPI00261A038C|nr:GMC family oxidoreductase [uncultured Shewanella sp.]